MNKNKNNKKINNAPSINNRYVFSEFEIIDKYDAGIVLTGTEIKSIRLSHVNIKEAFGRIDKNYEIYLYNMNISIYDKGTHYNHVPDRTRKLLLQKKEIVKIKNKIDKDKLTIVVLRLYFKGEWVKLEIATAKRKKLHDKRHDLKNKAIKLDIKRELKNI